MKAFLDDNFLLQTKTAQTLYHDFAKDQPIIDYHNHLVPAELAADKQFDTITQLWLNDDHYKWRAMRMNGIPETHVTGSATDKEKFLAFASTVPYTLRNPMYHWTHLELQRYFGINTLLNEKTASDIYEQCNEMLKDKSFSAMNLLRKMKVERLCTTDDPADNLEHHIALMNQGADVVILPTYRPDMAMNVGNPATFNNYVAQLEKVSDVSISSINDYLAALKKRHDFFATIGCCVSDHGMEHLYAEDYTDAQIATLFNTIRSGTALTIQEQVIFKSAMLVHYAEWDWEKGWVQQFHIGVMRNNNTRLFKALGPNTGFDSMGDFSHGVSLGRFLDRLDSNNTLAKTILYNLNPVNNELLATMAGNFCDGSVAGKVQFGSGWWFLDQKLGMTNQLNALSNMGLLSRFVGMLTDSRSLLSYTRHEYFRRILCNLIGDDIENGELPNDIEWTGSIVANICYNNAKSFFNWSR